MPTTPRGIWYPGSGDSTRLWEHLQQQAETTDAAIGVEAAKAILRHGQVSGLVNVVGTANTVTFDQPIPTTHALPTIVVTLAGSTTAITTHASITRTGFTVSARRVDNGAQFTGTFHYIARSALLV